jgi:hypothetical protein
LNPLIQSSFFTSSSFFVKQSDALLIKTLHKGPDDPPKSSLTTVAISYKLF